MHSTSNCFPLELRPHHGGTFPACSGGLWAIPSPFQLGLQQSCLLAETAEQQIPSCGSSLHPQDAWGAANPGGLGSAGMPHYTSPVLHSGAWARTSPELIFQQLRDEVLWPWRGLGSDIESFAAQRGAGEPSQVGGTVPSAVLSGLGRFMC